MADHIPFWKPGADVTLTASAAVTGGQVVMISGNDSVAPASAASAAWFGVAAFDAAAGDKVTVHRGGVHPLTASGAIAAGANVITAAAGAVATLGAGTPDQVVGIAVSAAANGKVSVALR